MSEETKEPKTFEDLGLMRETSGAWFNGQLSYDDVRKGADPEIGMVDGVSLHVVPRSDRVQVRRNTYTICEVPEGNSFSCRIEGETVAEYRSMEAFRDSEWWDLTMEKLAGGDVDASWLRTVELDGEVVDVDPVWIEYGPSVTVSMEVGNQYLDWLGNRRQSKGRSTLDIRVDRMSGMLSLYLDGHEVDGTVEEIEKAMMFADRLRRIGVEVEDGSITVPLRKGDDER